MSYYIAENFDGTDDLTDGGVEDIYGGLISGGIVDGGYESFLGGLGVHDESDTEDDDSESSSSESSSDSDAEVQKPPKKALNKLLEDPDIEPEPLELNELEDEHHEQTIEDILNMDDDDAGDLDEVSGGGKKKPAEPDIEFGVEEEEPQSNSKEDIFGVEEVQEVQEEDLVEEAKEDVEFGIEEVQEPQKEEPPKKKLERSDNLEVDDLEVDDKPTEDSDNPILGGSKFGDALYAYL